MQHLTSQIDNRFFRCADPTAGALATVSLTMLSEGAGFFLIGAVGFKVDFVLSRPDKRRSPQAQERATAGTTVYAMSALVVLIPLNRYGAALFVRTFRPAGPRLIFFSQFAPLPTKTSLRRSFAVRGSV